MRHAPRPLGRPRWPEINRGRLWRWWALAALVAMLALAAACTPVEDVPPLERRVQGLNKTIMCPVCPGESIDQSQNELAAQMRDIVAEKVQQGWTDEQIRAFFVDRYGPSVLLEPPRQGFNLMAWVVPPAAVAGAGVALYFVLRMMRRPPASRAEDLPDAAQLSEEERSRYFRTIEAAADSGSDGRGLASGGKGER